MVELCPRTGKVTYADKLTAKTALAKIKLRTKRRRSTRQRFEQEYYRCRFCHGWHLMSG